MAWFFVLIAGMLETVWIFFLKQTEQGLRPLGLAAMLAALICSFWLLSLAMRTIPLPIAYAVWSGIGTLGAFLLGLFFFGERLSLLAMAGMVLIVSGTILLRVASGGSA